MSTAYPTLPDSEVQFVRVGDTFGRLTVLDGVIIRTHADGKKNGYFFRCRCACGTVRDVLIASLMTGNTQSCGCLQRERTGDAGRTHGLAKKRIYRTWQGIKARCSMPSASGYEAYGARGIRVCEAWQDFVTFRDWALSSGYRDDLTIERVDVNGHYEPANCCWIPRNQQPLNQRRTVWAEAFGERKPASTWASDPRSKATAAAIHSRIKAGWDAEEAITTPTARVHRLTRDEADAIKADIAAGMSDRRVAQKYDIGRTTARYIRLGKLWEE